MRTTPHFFLASTFKFQASGMLTPNGGPGPPGPAPAGAGWPGGVGGIGGPGGPGWPGWPGCPGPRGPRPDMVGTTVSIGKMRIWPSKLGKIRDFIKNHGGVHMELKLFIVQYSWSMSRLICVDPWIVNLIFHYKSGGCVYIYIKENK